MVCRLGHLCEQVEELQRELDASEAIRRGIEEGAAQEQLSQTDGLTKAKAEAATAQAEQQRLQVSLVCFWLEAAALSTY